MSNRYIASETFNQPEWNMHTWPGDDTWRCYNCKDYGILKNGKILVPCVNCAEAVFFGGGRWEWYGKSTYGSWDGIWENTWDDVYCGGEDTSTRLSEQAGPSHSRSNSPTWWASQLPPTCGIQHSFAKMTPSLTSVLTSGLTGLTSGLTTLTSGLTSLTSGLTSLTSDLTSLTSEHATYHSLSSGSERAELDDSECRMDPSTCDLQYSFTGMNLDDTQCCVEDPTCAIQHLCTEMDLDDAPMLRNTQDPSVDTDVTMHSPTDVVDTEISTNLCLECGVDMGPQNPRQLCGKTYCRDQTS